MQKNSSKSKLTSRQISCIKRLLTNSTAGLCCVLFLSCGPVAETKPLAELKNRKVSLWLSPHINGGFEALVHLLYSGEEGCLDIPSDTVFKLNDKTLSGRGAYYTRGGGCEMPRYTGTFDSLPSDEEGRLSISDGSSSIVMTVPMLFAKRSISQVNGEGLRLGAPVSYALKPSGGTITEARLDFTYSDSGDQLFSYTVHGPGKVQVADGIVSFTVPSTGATGKGQLSFDAIVHSLDVAVCNGADVCEAELRYKIAVPAEVVAPYPDPVT